MKEGWRVVVGIEGTWGLCLVGAHSPATSPLARRAALYPPTHLLLHPLEACFTMGPWHIGGMTLGISLCIQPKRAPHPAATATRTTTAATLNPTASHPPLMHLHTEDRPNKVINQQPIFKWFAGRLKPLHTLPQVNSPTCCRARYPFSSADTGTASTGHLDINIYSGSLHCRGTNYLNISIYICLYLICLRQTNCLGYKAGLSWHPKVTADTERGGSFEYCS